MLGGNGNDTLNGDAGNDILDGGNGDDTLNGGSGSNIILGGNGNDTFIERVSVHAAGDYDFIDGQNGNDLLIIQASSQQALLLSSAINAFNHADKSHIFHFGDYANGLLNLDVVNVEHVQVSIINSPPVAANDTASIFEHGVPITGNVLSNDSDPDHDALSVAVPGTFSGVYGTLVLGANGNYTYTLNPMVSLAGGVQVHDTFNYKASDGSLASNMATLDVTITGVNDAPVAQDDAASIFEHGAPITGNVLSNDSDPDHDALSVAVPGTFSGVYGTLVLGANGNYTYTLNPTVSLAGGVQVHDTFHYQASDGALTSNTATLDVTITGVNDAPVAANDAASMVEHGVPATGNVLSNDADPDHDVLSVVAPGTFTGVYGTLVLGANGSYTYNLTSNIAGGVHVNDIFNYQASDGSLASNIATLTIAITGVNDAPVAQDDAASIFEHGGSVSGNVLTNDIDPDHDVLSVGAQGTFVGANGVLTLTSDGNYTYTLNPAVSLAGGAQVHDTFHYQASDGSLTSNTATLDVTITGVNDAPVAANDTASMVEHGVPATGNVLSNDSDPDHDVLSVAVPGMFTGMYGTLVLSADGSYNYALNPNASLAGGVHVNDIFNYQASDGSLASNIATLTIAITGVNDPPVAQDDTASIFEHGGSVSGNVLANDSDPDHDALSVGAQGTFVGTYGKLILISNGDYTYILDPTVSLAGGVQVHDTFHYQASDGSFTSNMATLDVTITGVNDAPVAQDDNYTINTNMSLQSNVLANDTDVDSASLTAILISAPSHGILTFNADGSFFYTPTNNFSGVDSFSYKANDGQNDSNTANVNITIVNPVNDPPVVTSALAALGSIDQPFVYTVTASDSDTPVANLTYSVDASSLPAGLTFDPVTHTISGTPAVAGEFDTTVMVSDGTSTTSAVVHIIAVDEPILGATADGQTISGVDNVPQLLTNNGFHAVLQPGVGDTVLLNFHHDPTFFNTAQENSIDTTGVFTLNTANNTLSLAGPLNLLVNDLSVSSALTPIKTINFDFDSAFGVGADLNGVAESIYVTNQSLIEFALIVAQIALAQGALNPTVNIHIDSDIENFMANNPDDMINVYEGFAYSVNLVNDSLIPVHFEDRWGNTSFINNHVAPTDDTVLVDVGLNSSLESSGAVLPRFTNFYDGGLGDDTLTLDLANLSKEDKSAFIAFKAAFDSMSSSDQIGLHTLYQDSTHSSGIDTMYGFTFQNFEHVELLNVGPQVLGVPQAGIGNDFLIGTGASNVLEGFLGSDTLTGGVGSDVFVFDYNDYNIPINNLVYLNAHSIGTDTITNFGIGADVLKINHMIDVNGDGHVDINDLNMVTTLASTTAGSTVQLNMWHDTNHNGVYGDSGDFLAVSIILQGHFVPVGGATHVTDVLQPNQVQFG